MDRSKASRSLDEGFSLIELLIVIVILGVLAAIVVFSVSSITDRGTTSVCQETVNEIDAAYEAAVAGGSATSTAATVTSLGPFFHSGTAPTTAGDNVITGATTVADSDAFSC